VVRQRRLVGAGKYLLCLDVLFFLNTKNTTVTYVCTNLRNQQWQNIASAWVIASIAVEHTDNWTAS